MAARRGVAGRGARGTGKHEAAASLDAVARAVKDPQRLVPGLEALGPLEVLLGPLGKTARDALEARAGREALAAWDARRWKTARAVVAAGLPAFGREGDIGAALVELGAALRYELRACRAGDREPPREQYIACLDLALVVFPPASDERAWAEKRLAELSK